MTLTVAPFGTYADATGVIDTTAAAEIVALGVILKAYFREAGDYSRHTAGTGAATVAVSEAAAASPGFDKITPEVAELINGEIDGLLAAVAAAPTS